MIGLSDPCCYLADGLLFVADLVTSEGSVIGFFHFPPSRPELVPRAPEGLCGIDR
jgi:hypothetical protein